MANRILKKIMEIEQLLPENCALVVKACYEGQWNKTTLGILTYSIDFKPRSLIYKRKHVFGYEGQEGPF